MNDRDRKMAMDACRPGSDDLQFDELRFLAQEMESDADLQREFDLIGQSDTQIAAQLADVDPPDDLRDRIVDRLELHRELTTALPRSSVLSRRWVLVSVGLAVTAALFVMASAFFGPSELDTITVEQLARWAQDEWKLGEQWTPIGNEARDRLEPLSQLLRQQPTRCQRFETSLDSDTTVYDFEQMPVPTRLFVLRVKNRLEHVPEHPQPVPGSGGWVTAAWQDGDHVYVLTVIGTTRDFYDVIRPQTPKMAFQYPASCRKDPRLVTCNSSWSSAPATLLARL